MKLKLAIVGVLILVGAARAAAQTPYIGDYDAELRLASDRKHVDCELMVQRLQELGANTYMWLMWHSPNDWDDLHDFLPLAQEANITVWAYLVPHSETAFQDGKMPYSEPFKLDYVKWAEEIAKLSLEYDNLVGYVIDDFWGNFDKPERFTPEYTRQMVEAGKAINPELRFYPLMYYRQFGLDFVEKLAPIIDGAVAAYPKDRAEIERALTFLNDEYMVPANVTIVYPPDKPSEAGDHGFITQTAKVTEAGQASATFAYADSYQGPTEGYHVMQLRVDDEVVWEEDAGGQDDAEATVDLSEAVAGKDEIKLALGVFDKKGVGNYAVRARFSDLRVKGIQIPDADLSDSDSWAQDLAGAFQVQFSPGYEGEGKFYLPLIVMPSGSRGAYKHRTGQEGTAELISAKISRILELVAEGKVQGVVTYCLNKQAGSEDFDAVAAVIKEFWARQKDK